MQKITSIVLGFPKKILEKLLISAISSPLTGAFKSTLC